MYFQKSLPAAQKLAAAKSTGSLKRRQMRLKFKRNSLQPILGKKYNLNVL